MLTQGIVQAGLLRDGGALVLIASLSHYVGYPGAAVYAATKDGLASFGRSMAVALAPRQISVLTVYPGPTRTAHARRYSPDNRHEQRRMPPEQLAALIFRATAAAAAHSAAGYCCNNYGGGGASVPGAGRVGHAAGHPDRLGAVQYE
ncbi:MAG: SDR family oxidoreductase [Chloroflexaceae bacterium]|nr:SDR family oxidoreductase [Chloroflexaceae bacterium]